MITDGLDIYHGNSIQISSDLVASFILHKCFEGMYYADPLYAARKIDARKRGILFGAYHFGTAGDVQKQVQGFLQAASIDAQTLLVLDLEGNPDKSATSEGSMSLMQAAEFVEYFHVLTGLYPILYTSPTALGSKYKATITQINKDMADQAMISLQKCELWIADSLNNPPILPDPYWKTWALWQNGQKKIDGVTIDIDNANFATSEALKEWWISRSPNPANVPAYYPIPDGGFVSYLLRDGDKNPNIYPLDRYTADVKQAGGDPLIALALDWVFNEVNFSRVYAGHASNIAVNAPPPAPTQMNYKCMIPYLRVRDTYEAGKPWKELRHLSNTDPDPVAVVVGSGHVVGEYLWLQLVGGGWCAAEKIGAPGNEIYLMPL